MKKLLFLIALVAMISCTSEEVSKVSTFSGSVENLGDATLMLMAGRDVDTLTVGPDGSFSITKELEKGTDFNLRINRAFASIYLAPGYDLNAKFNVEDFPGSIVYEGGLALENNYNLKYADLSKELSANMREHYALEAVAYRSEMEGIRKAKESMLDQYVTDNPDICKDFVKKQKINFEFSMYSSLSQYEPAHKYYAKVEEVELPEGWNDFENNIDINNPDYLDVPVAMSIVSQMVSKKIDAEGKASSDEDWGTAKLLRAQFDWILANVKNQEVENHLLTSNISSMVDYKGTSGIEEFVDVYYANCTDEKAIGKLKESAEEWAPLAAGEPAPEFTLPDINGKMVSLADFKGKYVYIDFWATWCGPCKVEIPVLEELAVKYADKNIEIMSISVDQDKQAWIDMVTKDKPEWLQLHDGIKMNDDYLVKFIPSFILIDRDGKIIDIRAPRPSEGEVLTGLFDSLEGI